MNDRWHSRRDLLAAGAAVTGAALAGCLGAPGSAETDASDGPPENGDIRIQSTDVIEEPSGGSDLAGSAGDGEPDWVDAHRMRFRGWYYADEYDPAMPYHRENITMSVFNMGGYVAEITVRDGTDDELYSWNKSFERGQWFRNSDAASAEIRVIGSAQNERLTVDLTEGAHHEIWLSGAVLTAGYWIGRW
ncbi:hypothetical protein [Natronocalculus amylovorans]|uniref:Uncharacterized protein n=1 Tax=Natronocalculus amylovorans TaxID=2917812 RepID=A0AAE3K8L8_9EURY|nr:hypothetical protein [Natronocalculus amylovorans]MCL9817452.1 hypothetical protein [Natronocalculus amylovorans]